MNEIKYMPIGVTPHWVVQNERILKLSEAVSRYAAFIDTEAKISNMKECYKYIAKWADEIKSLAEMEIRLFEERKEEK